MSAAKEIEKLREEIREHDRRYYTEAKPEISDRQYDRLMARLKELEAAHPDLITPDSPTQRVGEQPVEELSHVEHRVPMLSIDNTYSIDELRQYGARVAKLLPGEKIEWVVELKIDGVAVALVYEDGALVRGATRGSGLVGDDITHNIRTVRNVPLHLRGKQPPKVVEARGEVYMTNSDLVRLNQEQSKRGEPPFANTRNVTAGTIRLLDPRICAQRRLRFFCHSYGYAEGLKAATHMEFLEQMERCGLAPTPQVKCFESFDAAVEHCEELIEELHELDFEVDGLVLKVNSFDQRQRLGSTSKSPRWMVAYKFEKFEATTRLLGIRVQVGKTGAITPVADLEPVELAGTVVRRASLHNADEIERKDCRIGDFVVVEKAGKVIPHIVRTEKHRRKDHLEEFRFPTKCPECGTKLVKDPKGVYIRCPNYDCPAQQRERLIHFAGRAQMDIEGLGEEIIEQLLKKNLIRDFADLYTLSERDLANLTHSSTTKKGDVSQVRLGELTARKILASIQESKRRGLFRVLASLGIQHIGTQTARDIASRVKDIDELMTSSLERIRRIVVDDQNSMKLKEADRVARKFHEKLHSGDGRKRIDAFKTSKSKSAMRSFLDDLPKGRESWGVGWGKSKKRGKKDLLLKHFPTLDQLWAATVDDLVEAFNDNEDEVVGHSLSYLRSKIGRDMIRRLRHASVDMSSHERIRTGENLALAGKTVVATGTFEAYSRDEMHDLIRSHGGKPTDAVSRNTDFLVKGKEAGATKLKKAQELNVRVLNEQEFLALLPKEKPSLPKEKPRENTLF